MNFAAHNFQATVNRSRRASEAGHQLELGFATTCPPAGYRPRRLARANWWFQVMRQLVDRATDWQPAIPARPEQRWFPNTYRTVSLAPQPRSGQRELCE